MDEGLSWEEMQQIIQQYTKQLTAGMPSVKDIEQVTRQVTRHQIDVVAALPSWKEFQRLVSALYPQGVTYKKLREVCELSKGRKVEVVEQRSPSTQAYLGASSLRGGDDGYVETPHSGLTAAEGDLLMLWDGSKAGEVAVSDAGVVSSTVMRLRPDPETVEPRFLFHWLKRKHHFIVSTRTGGGIPHVNKDLKNTLAVPVPSLAVQEAITAYLDKFSELEAELEAELDRRQKQYEWYRTHLLDFQRQEVNENGEPTGRVLDYQHGDSYQARSVLKSIRATTTALCPRGVEYRKVQDVAEVFVGGDVKKFPISTDGATLVVSNGTGDNAILGRTNAKPRVTEPSVTISARGTIGHVQRFDEPISPVVRLIALVPKSDVMLQGFLFHVLRAMDLGGERFGIPSLTSKHLAALRLPAPPLPVQEVIIELLDHFDTLVNDISSGIPAEIAARRKQYEYYREDLLSFKPKAEGRSA